MARCVTRDNISRDVMTQRVSCGAPFVQLKTTIYASSSYKEQGGSKVVAGYSWGLVVGRMLLY
jgi:hypothetical protein